MKYEGENYNNKNENKTKAETWHLLWQVRVA